jgi:PAS domain S-box-containing protein
MEPPDFRLQLQDLFSGLELPPRIPSGDGDGRAFARTRGVSGAEPYRTLIENLPIGVYRVTPGPQSRLLMANQAFLDMFGVAREEVLGQAAGSDEMSLDHLTPGPVSESELQLKKRDGTPIWCSLVTRAMHNSSGELVCYDCVIQDITVGKRTEQSIWEADLWARRALDALEEAVMVVTLDRVLLNANAAAEEMFGYSHAELMCLSPEALYVDRYAEIGRTVQSLVEKGQEAHLTTEARRKNGETFPVALTLRVMRNDEGKPAAVLSVIRALERPAATASVDPLATQTLASGLTRACVYLGEHDDPRTHHGFPSNSNYCHAQTPPAAIELPYQSSACLTSNWGNCPHFKTALKRKR